MTNDFPESPWRTLTLQEVREFLKSQRPDVDQRSWERADLMTVLPWLLPAYAQFVRSSDSSKGAK